MGKGDVARWSSAALPELDQVGLPRSNLMINRPKNLLRAFLGAVFVSGGAFLRRSEFSFGAMEKEMYYL